MKFLDQQKIYIKAGMAVPAASASAVKNMSSTVDPMAAMAVAAETLSLNVSPT